MNKQTVTQNGETYVVLVDGDYEAHSFICIGFT